MLTPSEIAHRLSDGREWLVVSGSGALIDMEIPEGAGPVVVLVSEVTDAVKKVSAEGFVEHSLDRDRLWSVEALAVSGEVARRIDRGISSPADLVDYVERLGHTWQWVKRPSDP